MVLTLAMVVISSVAFAAQVVELNETYNLEQSRAAVNMYLAKDTRFYSSMRHAKKTERLCFCVCINQREKLEAYGVSEWAGICL